MRDAHRAHGPVYSYLFALARGRPPARRVPRHRHPVHVRQLRRRLGRVRRRSTTPRARSGARAARRVGRVRARRRSRVGRRRRRRCASIASRPWSTTRCAVRLASLPSRSSGTSSSASHSSIGRGGRREHALDVGRHVGQRAAAPRLRRDARSSRRATDPCRRPRRLGVPLLEIGLQRARSRVPVAARDPRRELGGGERLRTGEAQRARAADRGSASTAAATSAMSRGSIHAIASVAGREHEAAAARAARAGAASTDAKNDGCSTVDATGDSGQAALDRAVIAVQARCRDPRSAGSRSSRCARRRPPPRRRSRWSRARPDPGVGELTRNTRCTPANAARERRRIAEVGAHDARHAVDVGIRRAGHRAHGGAARDQARARPRRRGPRSHRSRARVIAAVSPQDVRG